MMRNIVHKGKARSVVVLLFSLLAASGCGAGSSAHSSDAVEAATLSARTTATPPPAPTLGSAANAAVATLEHTLYQSPARWNMCVPNVCGSAVRDWGADALTYTLFLRWKVGHDVSVVPFVAAVSASLPNYGPCVLGSCGSWSDTPLWDSIAASRAFEMTKNPGTLLTAEKAFATVDQSNAFALGACPTITYQRPGGYSGLKTLETDSNYIKAAILLYHWTGDPTYLTKAIAKYAAVRRYFLDPVLQLYTVYVFDTGTTCAQVPHRFFASVNGNMIYSGQALASLTHNVAYFNNAIATAQAVATNLSDAAGLYADLQADNDVEEPLVESMYDLAAQSKLAFAQNWLLRNASVSVPAANGAYGRFFDGPAPSAAVSAWSANGGLALAIAAGAIDPAGIVASPGIWAGARFVPDSIIAAPATIAFNGRAIALIGTIGDVCCEQGHVRVLVDGVETVDGTGIWQDKSPAIRPLPGSVLFAWRWPTAGAHTIGLQPGVLNVKEGGSYIHLQGYEVVP